jgi:small subunit ribosomal protein S16
MAIRIRLARMGAKKRPFYRVVVANAEAPRDGKFIEILGTYDPNQEPAAVALEKDALKKWLSKGAKPTETVNRLIRSTGILKELSS